MLFYLNASSPKLSPKQLTTDIKKTEILEKEANIFALAILVSDYQDNPSLLLNDCLTGFLKSLWTNKDIDFIIKSLQKEVIVISSVKNDIFPNSSPIITPIKELIHFISKNPTAIYQIDPWKFEEMISNVFSGIGYVVETTQRTRDGGIDIIATKSLDSIPLRFLIEVKRYRDKKVGISLVRSLYGIKHHIGASKAIIATTSDFTQPAREFHQAHRWELELKGFDDIFGWIKQYFLNQS